MAVSHPTPTEVGDPMQPPKADTADIKEDYKDGTAEDQRQAAAPSLQPLVKLKKEFIRITDISGMDAPHCALHSLALPAGVQIHHLIAAGHSPQSRECRRANYQIGTIHPSFDHFISRSRRD